MASYLFVSPHPDDAVFSMGGWMALLARQGHAVRVVTVFSRCPDPEVRDREDVAALAGLGVERSALGFTDVVLRRSTARGAHGFLSQDLPVVDEVRAALAPHARDTTVIGPLGVARHPDHQVAFLACAALDGPVAFYEDVPYALCPFATARRLAELGSPPPATDRRTDFRERAAIACWWMARPVLRESVPAVALPVAGWMVSGTSAPRPPSPQILAEERHQIAETMGAKMEAIERYGTQWPRFYRSLAEFRGALAGHARALGSPVVIERLFRRA